jgi:hypothetical protein
MTRHLNSAYQLKPMKMQKKQYRLVEVFNTADRAKASLANKRRRFRSCRSIRTAGFDQ